MSDLRERLRASFQMDGDYPSGKIGWELYLIERIAALEKVAEDQNEIIEEVMATGLETATNLGEARAHITKLERIAIAAATHHADNNGSTRAWLRVALREAGYLKEQGNE